MGFSVARRRVSFDCVCRNPLINIPPTDGEKGIKMLAKHVVERREGYVEMPLEFVRKLDSHIELEDEREQKWNTLLQQGEQRMDAIEKQLGNIASAVQKTEGAFEALKPLAKVITLLLTLLVALGGWIAKEKNSDMRAMQTTLMEHSAHFSRTIALIEGLAESDKRQWMNIERNTNILSNGGRK